MTTYTIFLAGFSPTVVWKPNANGHVRSIEEAIRIANTWVKIPDDVDFFLDESGELDATITARGPKISKWPYEVVGWTDFVHQGTGKVPFIVRPDIMESDEAIVAVFTHELYELAALRKILSKGRTITFDEFVGYCSAINPKNLHYDAWAAADKAVRRMRRRA